MEHYKVALFYDSYGRPNTGGTTVRPHNLVKMLLKFQIDFTIFSLNAPHPEYNIPGKIRNLSQFNPREYNVFWVENSFRAKDVLTKFGILPIYGTNIIPNSFPQHALPYINDVDKSRQERSRVRERQVIKSYKGKFWLSQSDFQEKEYRKLGLPYNIPVMRAPNPVDISLFHPPIEKPKEFIIGWTGKYNSAKKPEFLQKIASRFPEVTFYCFSDNEIPLEFTSNVKMMIRKTNKEVASLLRKCSAFISTSITDNQPLGVLEAMATALPVVGFRTSGMPEIISHGQTGFLVDLGNIEHFIVEIERLLLGYYDLRQIKCNARMFIMDNFSEEACIKQYIEIFKEYLER